MEKIQTTTVKRDCTGTFLLLDGKDYQVCNVYKVSSFSDGATVTATFKKIQECNGPAKDALVCRMFHANQAWIQIENIK
jgi:hypothetical protein